MPRFAANLMFLFTEWPLLERFQMARACGFDSIEYQFPYGEDMAAFENAVMQNGLQVTLINAPCGNRATGERGIAALSGREEEFRSGMLDAITWAHMLGCRRIHVMSGIVPPEDVEVATIVYADNLRYAARLCASEGIEVLIEPINGIDVPGYLVQRPEQARALLSMIGEENIFLSYDAYHAAVMGEAPLEGLRAYFDVIRHIQIADPHGRHEPDMSDPSMVGFFEACDMLGYSGVIGCEYNPREATLKGLSWASPYGIQVPA